MSGAEALAIRSSFPTHSPDDRNVVAPCKRMRSRIHSSGIDGSAVPGGIGAEGRHHIPVVLVKEQPMHRAKLFPHRPHFLPRDRNVATPY